MKNKKLLKIVILIILIIIMIPLATNVVQNLSEKAFIKKVEMSIEAYKNYKNSSTELSRIDITDEKLLIKNNKFKSGTLISMNEGEIEVYYITDGKYCASGKLGDLKVTKGPCKNDEIDNLVMKTCILNTNPNGGIWNKSKESQNIKLLNEEDFFITNPSRDNFIFEGWDVKITENISENNGGFLTTNFKAIWNDSNEEKIDKETNLDNLEEIFTKDLLGDFKIDKFNLKINPNGGKYNNTNDIINLSLKNNSEIKLLNPHKDGYKFKGWNVKVTGTVDEFKRVNLFIDLIAKYEVNVNILTIDLNDGKSSVNTISLKTDETYNLNIPSREGYRFVGWQLDNEKSKINESNNVFTMGSVDTKITAIWKKPHSLIIDLNGGTGSQLLTYEMVNGETLTLEPPQKANFIFYDWQLIGKDSKIENNIFTMGSEDTIIRAKWAETGYQFLIDLNGGTSNQILKNQLAPRDKFILNQPSKKGYRFMGWNVDGENSRVDDNTFTMGTGDSKVTAKWEILKYEIVYDLDGGSADNKTSYTIETPTFTLNNPTKEHYQFDGWISADSIESQTVTINKGSIGKRIYKAKWIPVEYKVKYNLDGGSADNKLTYNVETEDFTLVNPVKKGYTFIGWTGSDSNTIVTIPKGSSGDREYIANWELNTYEIMYNLNGGNADNKLTYTMETETFKLNNPIKEHYDFIGWTSSNNDTPILDLYIEKGTIDNIELTANYAPIKYDIVYELNDGSSVNVVKYTIEDEIVLPVLNREDFIFDGWYETEDFSGKEVFKVEKGTFGNKKFYAKWNRDYIINLDLNTGLPEGYTVLKYIESTGTQYIDTGFSAPEGFYGNATILFNELYGEESILGSHSLSHPYARNYIGTTNGGKVWEVGVGNIYESSTATLSVRNLYDIEFSTLKGNSYLQLENEKIISTSEANERSSNNVLLYTCQWVMHMGAPTAKMRIYALELYNPNNEKVRDFIPSINPDGVIGLYDKVEGKFYENAGTGTFNYEKVLPSTELTKLVSLRGGYGTLPIPERKGYKFVGWYTEATGGLEITSDTVVTEDAEGQKLYAKWKKNYIYENDVIDKESSNDNKITLIEKNNDRIVYSNTSTFSNVDGKNILSNTSNDFNSINYYRENVTNNIEKNKNILNKKFKIIYDIINKIIDYNIKIRLRLNIKL